MAVSDGIKKHISELEPYKPGKTVEEVEREFGIRDSAELASNENPLGPSPRALNAMRSAIQNVHRYPDGYCYALRKGLAEKLRVDEGQLVFGAGSDELLGLIAKGYLAPGDEAVFGWPGFAMYPIVVQGMGAKPIAVPLTNDLVLDLEEMLKVVTVNTRVVFLCNPNNPTGTSVGMSDFEMFLNGLRPDILLVVDEAYYEYVRRPDFPDALSLVEKRPGICVLRTFSKIYGLAGMRIGYGVMDTEMATYLERARHPFNVSSLAEAGALAALDDTDHVESSRRINVEGIDYLTRALSELSVRTWPTDANFLLAEVGTNVYEPLLRKGIIVRPMAGFGLPDCIRITVGMMDDNRRCVAALSEVMERRE